jgi:hypothetical protein
MAVEEKVERFRAEIYMNIAVERNGRCRGASARVLGVGERRRARDMKEGLLVEVIGIGAAAGLIVAAACMMFYRKGVRDGAGVPAKAKALWGGGTGMKRGAAPQAGFKAAGSDEDAMAMMKRYETILSYDPYNSPQKAALFGNPEGERV